MLEVKIENLSNFSGQLKKGINNCLAGQIAGQISEVSRAYPSVMALGFSWLNLKRA